MSAQPMRAAAVLAIGVAVALTGATLASVTGAVAAVQGDKAKEEKSRRVCRTVTPSGSRLVRRVCRSQEDWDATQQKTQDGVLELQMRELDPVRAGARPHWRVAAEIRGAPGNGPRGRLRQLLPDTVATLR